jgi:hypothetical protein
MEEDLKEVKKDKKAFKPKITPLAADPKTGRGKKRAQALAETIKKNRNEVQNELDII